MSWEQQALCRPGGGVDPDVFFDPAREAEALRVCNGDGLLAPACPVREECLQVALEELQDLGVQGGTTPAQRQAILRRRKAAGPRAGLPYAERLMRMVLAELQVPRTRLQLAELLDRDGAYMGRLLRDLEQRGLVRSWEQKESAVIKVSPRWGQLPRWYQRVA